MPVFHTIPFIRLDLSFGQHNRIMSSAEVHSAYWSVAKDSDSLACFQLRRETCMVRVESFGGARLSAIAKHESNAGPLVVRASTLATYFFIVESQMHHGVAAWRMPGE